MQESENSMSSASLHATLDPAAFARKSEDHHIADVVEALNALTPSLAASVLEAMPLDRVTDILEQPGFDRPQDLIERLPLDRAADFVGAMSADRRADVFRRLSDLIAATVGSTLVGIVTFGSLTGSMLPFILKGSRLGSGQRFGALCRNACRRHRPGHLLQRRIRLSQRNRTLACLGDVAADWPRSKRNGGGSGPLH